MKKLLSYLALLCVVLTVPLSARAGHTYYVDNSLRKWSNIYLYVKNGDGTGNYAWGGAYTGTKDEGTEIYTVTDAWDDVTMAAFTNTNRYNGLYSLDTASYGTDLIGIFKTGNSGDFKLEEYGYYILGAEENTVTKYEGPFITCGGKCYTFTKDGDNWVYEIDSDAEVSFRLQKYYDPSNSRDEKICNENRTLSDGYSAKVYNYSQDGGNFTLPAGNYRITISNFSRTENEAGTLSVNVIESSDSYKLSGSFTGDWTDIAMNESDGVWTYSDLSVTNDGAKFGIKKVDSNGSQTGWYGYSSENYTISGNCVLDLVDTGTNDIYINKGTYNFSYNPTTMKLTVSSAVAPAPSVSVDPTSFNDYATSTTLTFSVANTANAWYKVKEGEGAFGAQTAVANGGTLTLENNTNADKTYTVAYGYDSEQVGTGTYTLKAHDTSALTYALHGSFTGSWESTDLTKSGSVWTAENVKVTNASAAFGIKVLEDGGQKEWLVSSSSISGSVSGETITMSTSGSDISIAQGTYNFSYNPTTKELTVKLVPHALYVYGPITTDDGSWVNKEAGLMTTEDGVTYKWTKNGTTTDACRYFRIYDKTENKIWGWNEGNYYLSGSNGKGAWSTAAMRNSDSNAIYIDESLASSPVDIYFDLDTKKVKYDTPAAIEYFFCQRQDGKTWYDADNDEHGTDSNYPGDAVDVNNTMVPLIANGDGTYSADVVEVRGSGVLTAAQVEKICGTAVTYVAPDRSFVIRNAAGTQYYGAANSANKVENGTVYKVSPYSSVTEVNNGHRMNVKQTIVAVPGAGTEFANPSSYAKKCTITFNPTSKELTISGEKPVYTIYGTFNGWDYTSGHELLDIESSEYVDSGVFGVFIPSLSNGTNDDNPGFKILTQNQQHNTRSWGRKGENWTPADEIPSTTSSDPTDVYQAYSLVANPTGDHTQGMNNLLVKDDVDNVYVLFFPEDDILNSYIVEDAKEGRYTLVGTLNSWNSKSVKHSFTKVQEVRDAGYIKSRKYKLKLSNLAGSFKLVESGTDMTSTNYKHYLPSDKEYANGQSQTITLSDNNPAASPRRQVVDGDKHLTNALTLESGTLQNVTLTIEETYDVDGATVTKREFSIVGDPVYSVVVVNGSDVKYYRMSTTEYIEDTASEYDRTVMATVPKIPHGSKVYIEVDEYKLKGDGTIDSGSVGVDMFAKNGQTLPKSGTEVYTTEKVTSTAQAFSAPADKDISNATIYFYRDYEIPESSPEFTGATIVIPGAGVSYRLIGNYGGWGEEYAYTFTPDASEDNTYVLTIPELQMNGNKGETGFQIIRVETDGSGDESYTYYGHTGNYASYDDNGTTKYYNGLDDASLSKGQSISLGKGQDAINIHGKKDITDPTWLDSVVLTLTVGNTMSSAKGRAAAAVGTGLPQSLTVKSTVATAIDEVEADLYPADVYTLTGVCVLRDASMDDLRNLAPGLYIYKGKKLIIK